MGAANVEVLYHIVLFEVPLNEVVSGEHNVGGAVLTAGTVLPGVGSPWTALELSCVRRTLGTGRL